METSWFYTDNGDTMILGGNGWMVQTRTNLSVPLPYLQLQVKHMADVAVIRPLLLPGRGDQTVKSATQ